MITIHLKPKGNGTHEWIWPEDNVVDVLTDRETIDRMRETFDVHGAGVTFHWFDLIGQPSERCLEMCGPQETLTITAPNGRELLGKDADDMLRRLQAGVFFLPQTR